MDSNSETLKQQFQLLQEQQQKKLERRKQQKIQKGKKQEQASVQEKTSTAFGVNDELDLKV